MTDVVEGMRDGSLLIDLMEVMSGKAFTGKRGGAADTRIKKIDKFSLPRNFSMMDKQRFQCLQGSRVCSVVWS